MIISTLSAVVIPRLKINENFQRSLYIDDLFSTLRAAKKRAIATNCPIAAKIVDGQVSLWMAINCSMDNLDTGAGLRAISDTSGDFDMSWQDRWVGEGGQNVFGDTAPNVNLIFDGRGRAHSYTAPYGIADITIPAGANNIKIIGETGLIYFSGLEL